mmetsp:Transcript_38708/g.62024  ORF Transcript_38708/g.62024 Transcript_38708/m.62024 type:complete len:277 (-) Transcript_38708:75-905(-)
MARMAWNCGLSRRKSRMPPPPSPPAPRAPKPSGKRFRGWVLGPPGPGAAPVAAAALGAGGGGIMLAKPAPALMPAAAGAGAGARGSALSGIPVSRYSTARSGLLNAARSALTHISRSNPIAIMFAMVSSNADPDTRVDALASGLGAVAAASAGRAATGAGAAGVAEVAGGAIAGVTGVAGTGAGGGLGAALAFCCITTMKLASVTPAAASVVSSVSTLPLCTSTIVSAACDWLSASFALTAETTSSGSSSTSNFAFASVLKATFMVRDERRGVGAR